jgi:hypothetical protein
MSTIAALTCTVGLILSTACAGSAAINGTPTSQPTTTAAAPQDRETVAGRFTIIFGDPPPDSNLPAQRRYTLTEPRGRQWTLVFDEKIYSPPDGILSFNGKDVEVEGRRTGSDRLLVESIRLR